MLSFKICYYNQHWNKNQIGVYDKCNTIILVLFTIVC